MMFTSPEMNAAALRVMLIEDHALMSEGVKQLLSSLPGYRVVGEVTDGLDAYSSCQRLTPDLVLMDLGLPGMDGIDVIHQLKQRWPALTVMVLTANSTENRARAALDAGAAAYILKKSSQQMLVAALQAVRAGRTFIDPALDSQQISEKPTLDGVVSLTLRERQILKLIAQAQRNRDIAERLKITIKTVETHRLNLMRKLDAHSAVALTNWAVRLGIHES